MLFCLVLCCACVCMRVHARSWRTVQEREVERKSLTGLQVCFVSLWRWQHIKGFPRGDPRTCGGTPRKPGFVCVGTCMCAWWDVRKKKSAMCKGECSVGWREGQMDYIPKRKVIHQRMTDWGREWDLEAEANQKGIKAHQFIFHGHPLHASFATQQREVKAVKIARSFTSGLRPAEERSKTSLNQCWLNAEHHPTKNCVIVKKDADCPGVCR